MIEDHKRTVLLGDLREVAPGFIFVVTGFSKNPDSMDDVIVKVFFPHNRGSASYEYGIVQARQLISRAG